MFERDEELAAAEDYRRQRQASDANRSGIPPISREQYLAWFDDNPELLLSIAIRNGIESNEAVSVILGLRKLVEQSPRGSSFDDPGTMLLMRRRIEQIERACIRARVKPEGGVVFGASGSTGLDATQRRVLQTDVSILEVTRFFFVFCDLVSKAFANTLPHEMEERVQFSVHLDRIAERLQRNPWILEDWGRVLLFYAIRGLPPRGLGRACEGKALVTRAAILETMELFALAHEYGHHVLNHSCTSSSEGQTCSFEFEHQADLFARLILYSTEPPQFLASCGVGATLMLGSLELIGRSRQVLLYGTDEMPIRKHHPPLSERLQAIDRFDCENLPNTAQQYSTVRASFLKVLELVWQLSRPAFMDLHKQGVRPNVDEGPDVMNWLPLA